jgi:hypothetical protein
MKVQELINDYKRKINQQEVKITHCQSLLRKARNGNCDIDVDDVENEKGNAESDRQIYFQFTKDLEDLL